MLISVWVINGRIKNSESRFIGERHYVLGLTLHCLIDCPTIPIFIDKTCSYFFKDWSPNDSFEFSFVIWLSLVSKLGWQIGSLRLAYSVTFIKGWFIFRDSPRLRPEMTLKRAWMFLPRSEMQDWTPSQAVWRTWSRHSTKSWPCASKIIKNKWRKLHLFR